MPASISTTIPTRSKENPSLITNTEIIMANNTLVSRSTATGAMRSWVNAQIIIQ